MTTSTDPNEFELIDEPDLTIPEDTICPAKLVELDRQSFKWTDLKDRERPGVPIEKTGENLVWWFEVTGGEYEGRKIRGKTRTTLSTKTRGNMFKPWAETLLGREIETGARIHKDDLVGLPCEITVKHVKDRKDPSKFYEEIDEVIPVTGDFDFNSEPPF